MVEYKCNRCCKIYTNKYDYNRHKNRKYPCKKPYQNDTIPIPQKSESQDSSKNNHTSKSARNKKRYMCAYCGNNFTQSSSRNRHEKYRCKIKKEEENII